MKKDVSIQFHLGNLLEFVRDSFTTFSIENIQYKDV